MTGLVLRKILRSLGERLRPQLQLAAVSEQFLHLGGRSRDLLKVIEEQQQHPVAQLFLKLVEQRSIACFP